MKTTAPVSTLSVPGIFSNGMVLQRDLASDIFGWAPAGSTVQVELCGQTVSTKACKCGKWRVKSPILPAGGPFEMVITSGSEKIVIKDVLIGEVWLCSGQSNMEWQVHTSANFEEEIAKSTDPMLRYFTVEKAMKAAPIQTIAGTWESASPEKTINFGAAAYFMARELRKRLNVPVGIINSSWGGTSAEAWTPRQQLNCDPAMRYYLGHIPEDPDAAAKEFKPYVDPGNKCFAKGWANKDFDDSQWKLMDLPRIWESTGLNIDGAVWFRLHVTIPDAWIAAGKDLTLSLGALDDFDETYFNGTRVGGMALETPNVWITPRVYTIPHKLLAKGENVIATRIFDQWGGGGFVGQARQMFLMGPDEAKIPLAGNWKFDIELELPPAPMGSDVWPTSLYNGMIHPIVGYGIRGCAWYQGENNSERAFQYRDLMATLINGWRKVWGRTLPFIQVQLANWETGPSAYPRGSHWAELREAQAVSADKLPSSTFITAVDIGDSSNIHPTNKQDVGLRLALAALGIAYGQKVEYLGPTFESVSFKDGKATVTFTHAEGMTAKGEITEFIVAGTDQVFHPAKAVIKGNTVEVTCGKVAEPAAVRYAWAADPKCNIYNGANLPMPPFRTDGFPYLTLKNR